MGGCCRADRAVQPRGRGKGGGERGSKGVGEGLSEAGLMLVSEWGLGEEKRGESVGRDS